MYQYLRPLLVEVRRIELLSEDSEPQFSPSAGKVLRFPPPAAPCRASGIGSFMVPGYGKAYIAPFPTFLTPVTCAVGSSGPTRCIKQRKRTDYCQLILSSPFLRGQGPRLAYHAPDDPRRNQCTPLSMARLNRRDCPASPAPFRAWRPSALRWPACRGDAYPRTIPGSASFARP